MLKVIGNENCSRCEIVKNKLKNDNIQFEYSILNQLDPNERQQYIKMARESGQLALPIIIKDDKVITIQEVK